MKREGHEAEPDCGSSRLRDARALPLHPAGAQAPDPLSRHAEGSGDLTCPTGLFIVLDGVEGCGKSTQIRLLADHLRAQGREVVVTVEPGGTPVGQRVRELLLDPQYPEMTPLTEVLLFCASRAQHCDEVIRPALNAGKVVVCDRFASSTIVYQGIAGDVGLAIVRAINAAATGGLEPDLLIVLDLDPAAGMRRKFGDAAASGDRIEEKSLEFHQRVRQGFLDYAAECGPRAVVIAALNPPKRIKPPTKK